MKRIVIALALGLTAALAHAQPSAEQQAQMEERMASIVERLELTDEQKTQLEPIVADSLTQQQEILAKYGIDPENRSSGSRPSPRQAMQLRREMETVREATKGELAGILSDEQLAEYARIQEEAKAEMRKRMRGGR